MSRLKDITCFGLAAGLAVGALPAQVETQGFGIPKDTTLQTIRDIPDAFKNVWVRFTGQFFSVGPIHNPFFTRFTRADYVNFAVWAHDQKIWEKEEFDNPCSTLFCSKASGDLLTTVYDLQMYERVRVTGIVRNTFKGEPWIEVNRVEPIAGRITTASLTHLGRARRMIQNHRWQQATVELNLASSQSLTEHARGWVHAYLGLCYMRVGKPNEAEDHLEVAAGLLPQEQDVQEWLDGLARDPRGEVDTHVTMSQVRSGDRPMWEAVEDARDQKARQPSRPGWRKPTKNEPEGQDNGGAKAPTKDGASQAGPDRSSAQPSRPSK